MNSRANLSKIEQNYPENYRKGFEDLSTHMFMRMLGISAPLRRTNQKGIEADPVDVKIKDSEEFKSGCYTFQSKYYEPRTEISDKKDEFLKSIAVAKERGATDHIFFVNKDLKENSRTGEIPSYEAEINNAAIEAGITLHWYTRDRIETELDFQLFLSRADAEAFINGSEFDEDYGVVDYDELDLPYKPGTTFYYCEYNWFDRHGWEVFEEHYTYVLFTKDGDVKVGDGESECTVIGKHVDACFNSLRKAQAYIRKYPEGD